MIGSDDHEGLAIATGEVEGDLHGLVEVDRFPNLPARVGRVGLLVDRSAFDLQEEAVGGAGKQFDRLGRHLAERRSVARTFGIVFAGDRGKLKIAAQHRLGANPAHGHVAAGEEAEDRKSTRLNSSHVKTSYAVVCCKKKS